MPFTKRASFLFCMAASVALVPSAAYATEQAAVPADAPAQTNGLTPDVIATMDRLGDAALSPDGRWLAYVVQEVSPSRTSASMHIMLADLSDPAARHLRMTAGAGRQAAPQWSRDGRSLYFRAPDEAGIWQLWRSAPDGADATPVTSLIQSLGSYRVAPDESFVVASLTVYPDCPDLACSVERKAQPQAGQLYETPDVRYYDKWEDGRKNALFRIALDGERRVDPLMSGFDSDAPPYPTGDESSFSLSPDGARLVFSARPSGTAASESPVYRLFETSLRTPDVPRELFPDQAGALFAPTFSPDGRWLAWLDKDGSGSDGDYARVYVQDQRSGKIRELGAEFDRWPSRIQWAADSKSLLAVNDDMGCERLFAYRLNGTVERVAGGDGVSAVSVAEGKLALTVSSIDQPTQVYLSGPAGQGIHPVTDVGLAQLAGLEFSPSHSFTFKGWNDEEVQAFVVEPLNRQPGKTYPFLFMIHGGPHGTYNDEWTYLRNPQIWAARGYATVMINFHGSTGQGQDFAWSVLGHRGDRVLEDLQKGLSAALEDYSFIDGTRGCALGTSFGAYMVDWIAGAWNEPWRCLVSHAGAFDLRAMAYTSDIHWHNDRQAGGAKPWEDPQAVERFNPVNLVDRWSKPLLVTHGGRDFRVPFDQGLAAYTAAQRRGIPSQLLQFPDGNHSSGRTQESILWYNTVLAWLDRWTAQ